jgi:hypothetical protein
MNGQSTKMGVYYECVKCGYLTNIKSHMEKHYTKKYKCKWKNIHDSKKYKTDSEVFEECMKKKYPNSEEIYSNYKHIQEESKDIQSDVNHLDPYVNLCLSKKNPKKKEYKCDFCKKVFKEKCNMRAHQSSCKIKKIVEIKENDSKPEEEKVEDDSDTEEVIPKVCDHYISLLCRFFEAVDISHILEEKHIHNMLYLSYEKIFTEIMRNERNNNFYVSFESTEMIIYKDEINDVKKIPVEKGYSKICMNIHEYLMNQIEKLKTNPDYNKVIIKEIEKKIKKMNKKYRFNDEYKNKFFKHICEFCREKKSMIFARFTQNFIANQEHRNQFK